MRCQVERERRVAALVFPETDSVDPHGGGGHRALEVEKNVFAGGIWWQPEASTIGRNKLVVFVVEVVPWRDDIRMRQNDSIKS